jgi:hypothetical protein
MKIYKTEKVEVEQKTLTGMICDLCGKSYGCDVFEIQEFLCIDTMGGYGSVFGDEEPIKLDICQYCLYDIYKKSLKHENI